MALSPIQGTFFLIIAFLFIRRVRTMFTSGFDALDGPAPSDWLLGNLGSLREPQGVAKKWIKQYGQTFRLSGFFGIGRLYTLDLVALEYIVKQNSDTMTKSVHILRDIAAGTGPGLVVAEHDDHKRQRKILNPAFTQSQAVKLIPISLEKASQVVALWKTQVGQSGGIVNIIPSLCRATLDVVGEAGFGYNFNSIQAGSEVSDMFLSLFSGSKAANVWEFVQAIWPFLRHIPVAGNRVYKAQAEILRKTCQSIVDQKMTEYIAYPEAEKTNLEGGDILSVIIKSNFAHKAGGQGLSDEEMLAQVATVVATGHETSATALTWILYSLAQHPEVQRKLREEVTALPHDDPTTEELQALAYLDSVIKESLRLHPPIHFTSRQMTVDQVIPLSSPVIGRDGKLVQQIQAMRGDMIIVDISEINRNPDFWGSDADDFRPERWSTISAVGPGFPTVYAHTLTFLGGPKGCIGWRMAVVEIKAFLFTIIRNFELEVDPNMEVYRRLGKVALGRPVVRGQEHLGDQMPLTLRPITTQA